MKGNPKQIDADHIRSVFWARVGKALSDAVLITNRLKRETGDSETADILLHEFDELSDEFALLQEAV